MNAVFGAAQLVRMTYDELLSLTVLRALPRELLLEALGVNPFFRLDEAPPALAQGCRCGAQAVDLRCACGALLCYRCYEAHATDGSPCAAQREERLRRGEDGEVYEELRRLHGTPPCAER